MGEDEYSFNDLIPLFLRGGGIILTARYDHSTREGCRIHAGEEGKIVYLVDLDAPEYKTGRGFRVTVIWRRSGYSEYKDGMYKGVP